MIGGIVPADYYDTLELACEAYDGIGCGSLRAYDSERSPICWLGFMHFIGVQEIEDAFGRVGVNASSNDSIVRNILISKGMYMEEVYYRTNKWYNIHRVTFQEWAKEANIVRGE